MSRPTVPHHGPVGAECPLECLLTVPLSLTSYNRLKWNCDQEPGSVGDVVALYTRGGLSGVRGLGPKRITEIAAVLVLAGFDLSVHADPAQSRSA
jgi:hypothetical protein